MAGPEAAEPAPAAALAPHAVPTLRRRAVRPFTMAVLMARGAEL
jgi:hypothetical protein